MTVGQFRLATLDVPDSAEVSARVTSAPFDDETVELQDIVIEKGRVYLCVAVVDEVTREIRAEDARLQDRPLNS